MNCRFALASLAGLSAMAAVSAASAAVRHVPFQHPTIQSAINASTNGDTVIVAAGIYTGAGNRDISFHGKALTVRSAAGPSLTIINVQASSKAPARGFIFNSGENESAVLEGFTIRNGATAIGAVSDLFNGGGILCTNSSPTIRNCIIENNEAACWGGGIACTNASPRLENCVLRNNVAGDDGGGLFAWSNSSPAVVNAYIYRNHAGVTGGGVGTLGGGVGPQFYNVTITQNTAMHGSGVFAFNGTNLFNSIVWDNTGMSGQQIGGSSSVGVFHSVVEGGFATGSAIVNADPLFVDPVGGNFRLRHGSPAVNAGISCLVMLDTDPDGDPRFVGGIVDAGADEFRKVADINADGTVDPADLGILLANWGPCFIGPWDFNGDIQVNAHDLGILLGQWGD